MQDLGDLVFAWAVRRCVFEAGSSEEVVDGLVRGAIDDVLALVWLEPDYVGRLAGMWARSGDEGSIDAVAMRRFVVRHPLG